MRGYFDGDGSVSSGFCIRKYLNNKKQFYMQTCFVSGCKSFLSNLSQKIHLIVGIGMGSLKRKSHNRAY